MSFKRDQVRQFVLVGGLNFAGVLAQFRRDPVELQLRDRCLPRFCRRRTGCLQTVQAVLIKVKPHLQCALAQGDAVVLRAGEILQARSVGVRRQGADIDLQAEWQFEADLVVAFGKISGRFRETDDLLDEGGALLVVDAARTGDEHIKIANGFAAAAKGAGGGDGVDAFDVFQVRGEFFGGAVGLVNQEASGDAAIVLDGLEDLLFALFAHAGKSLQLAFFGELFDAVKVADLEGAPDQSDGLRSEALDFEQLQHGWVKFLQQFLMQLELSGLCNSWMLAAMPLPMPGISSSFFGSSARSEACCGKPSMVSAARR